MDSPIEGLSGQAAALRPRTARLLLGLAGALAATAIAGFFAAGMASGDEEAGGSTGRGIVDRIRRLEQEIMCSCPRENWSRTLSNCPDPCADEQKEQIRDMVARGASDEAIYGFMADSHGPKALSSPGWKGVGKWAYLLPPFFVLAGAVVATLVILHWRNQGELERERRESLSTAVSTGEIEQVERELEKLD